MPAPVFHINGGPGWDLRGDDNQVRLMLDGALCRPGRDFDVTNSGVDVYLPAEGAFRMAFPVPQDWTPPTGFPTGIQSSGALGAMVSALISTGLRAEAVNFGRTMPAPRPEPVTEPVAVTVPAAGEEEPS